MTETLFEDHDFENTCVLGLYKEEKEAYVNAIVHLYNDVYNEWIRQEMAKDIAFCRDKEHPMTTTRLNDYELYDLQKAFDDMYDYMLEKNASRRAIVSICKSSVSNQTA